jgi:hypothetical protein
MSWGRPFTPVRLLWLGTGTILVGAAGLVVAVIAFGVFMSRPAPAVIGAPPTDLHAENVAISSASGQLFTAGSSLASPAAAPWS